MPRISEQDIARIREATDIVQLVSERVVLKQKGRLFWGCCPFHQEKTPSFKVDPAAGLWYCFGCGEGGDVVGYTMRMENLDFPETIRTLADRANIELELIESSASKGLRSKVFAVCADAATFYHHVLTTSPDNDAVRARAYLAGRDFGSEIAHEWTLGYAPGRGETLKYLRERGHEHEAIIASNVAVSYDGETRDRFYARVMFPIFDLQNRCIAFGGRALDDGMVKYINTSDTPIFSKQTQLYGLNVAKSDIVASRTVLVVEGYTDVIALHSAGHRNAVATLGTSLTAGHLKLLSRFASRIVYVFDGDEAGKRAADRATEFIDTAITPEYARNPVEIDVLVLPPGSDPADMMASEDGRIAFEKLLAEVTPLIEQVLAWRLARYDLTRLEQQQRAIDDAVSVLAPIKGSVIASGYAQLIVDSLVAAGARVTLEQVLSALKSARTLPRHETAETPVATPVQTTVALTPMEVEVLGLMIANSAARRNLSECLTVEMLDTDVACELFEKIAAAPPEAMGATILAELAPAVVNKLAAYDFDAATHADNALTREVSQRVMHAHREKEIARLRLEMGQENDETRKAELAAAIAKLRTSTVVGGA
ncbi:MAG: DNA primase [Coriobacteriia bacterium]|nr:DNA primase [Coriobacteriia bacterium]